MWPFNRLFSKETEQEPQKASSGSPSISQERINIDSTRYNGTEGTRVADGLCHLDAAETLSRMVIFITLGLDI
jgi:hypothetical protein